MGTFKVLEIEHLTDQTFRLRTERSSAPIIAGQCFNVGIPGSGINREYSMYSNANAPFLEFLIREVPDGMVSPELKKIKVGDPVEVDGPYGQFCLKEPFEPDSKYLFLATGTGIAPFRSFAQTFPGLNFSIYHGIRLPEEQYGGAEYAPGQYVACVSQDVDETRSLRVTEYLKRNPVDPDTIVYLCGNRNMIVDAFSLLREQGVGGDNLFTEVFF